MQRFLNRLYRLLKASRSGDNFGSEGRLIFRPWNLVYSLSLILGETSIVNRLGLTAHRPKSKSVCQSALRSSPFLASYRPFFENPTMWAASSTLTSSQPVTAHRPPYTCRSHLRNIGWPRRSLIARSMRFVSAAELCSIGRTSTSSTRSPPRGISPFNPTRRPQPESKKLPQRP